MAALIPIDSISKAEAHRIYNNFFGEGVTIESDMTAEQYAEYYAAENESGGFDVPYVPNTVVHGRTVPIFNFSYRKKELDKYGGIAISHFNQEYGTCFEIVNFVKVNTSHSSVRHYYMTFDATQDRQTDRVTTFQAEVFAGIGGTEVDFCRVYDSAPTIDRSYVHGGGPITRSQANKIREVRDAQFNVPRERNIFVPKYNYDAEGRRV